MTAEKEKTSIDKIAEAALKNVRAVCPDAQLTMQGDDYYLRLGGPVVRISPPERPLKGLLCSIHGLSEDVPKHYRQWIVVGILNSGKYVKPNVGMNTLEVYSSTPERFLTRSH